MKKINLETFEETNNVYIKTIYGDEFICDVSIFIDGEDNYEEDGDYGIDEIGIHINRVIQKRDFVSSKYNLIRQDQIEEIKKL